MDSRYEQMKPAKQQDWKTIPLPARRACIRLSRTFSIGDIRRMRPGLVPEEMEDKWFIYWKRNALYFHRSWTGHCVYVVRFIKNADSYTMVEAAVNREPRQYSETSDERDARMISYLIDELLLRQESEFPGGGQVPGMNALENWSEVGRAMLGEHPGGEASASLNAVPEPHSRQLMNSKNQRRGMTALGKLLIVRMTGQERFTAADRSLGFDVMSFWQWASSDLVNNTARGVLAEYLVARAVGLGKDDIREEWTAWDLETPSGIRIQVKSAAFLQSWHQKKLSTIVFGVQAKRAWVSSTNVLAAAPHQHSDVYVFALLAHKNKATIDPLNTDQWQFYVLPTATIASRKRSQHSITLKSLEELCSPVSYASLGREIEEKGRAALSNANTAL